MMTLDEAIEHAEWCADNSCGECAEEHRQLAEWLKELRERQDVDAEMEDERDLLFERLGYCREALTDARSENAKLRELVNSYADLFEKEAAKNNWHGPYYSGEDWLAMANDMRIELAKCCGELGTEV